MALPEHVDGGSTRRRFNFVVSPCMTIPAMGHASRVTRYIIVLAMAMGACWVGYIIQRSPGHAHFFPGTNVVYERGGVQVWMQARTPLCDIDTRI